MKKIAFRMSLKADCVDEYQRRHDEIWPELKNLLKSRGVQNYRIYFDSETHHLFATLECPEGFETDKFRESPIMRRWWGEMAELMETHEDYEPKVQVLRQVFHLK